MTRQGAIDYFVSRKENGERLLCNKCRDAEDWAIKALESYPEWVSVKNGTPSDHEPVLVYSLATGSTIACYTTSGKWLDETGNYVYEVTHWMPLLNPPEDVT